MQVITLNLVFIYGSFNMFIVALMADRSHVNSQNLVTSLEEQVRHDHPQRKILRTNHSTGKHSVQPQKPLFSLTPGLIQVLVFGLCFVCMQHIPCSLPSRAVCIKCWSQLELFGCVRHLNGGLPMCCPLRFSGMKEPPQVTLPTTTSKEPLQISLTGKSSMTSRSLLQFG